jgi:hypothetical protein
MKAKMVDPEKVGFWAPYPKEPMSHFDGKVRLRNILEPHRFDVYPEYQVDEIIIEELGPRNYREDLYCEHQTISHWRFYVTVYGGIHFASHKQRKKTEHRKKAIEDSEEIPVIEFEVDELVGKYKLDDHQIRERLGLDTW